MEFDVAFQARGLSAMRRACSAVLEIYAKKDHSVEYKEGNEPVTAADLACNRILEKELSAMLPQAGWLSEESGRDLEALSKKELLWVVDPIDGTREFMARNDQFAISVGLVKQGLPVWGMVALPAEDLIAITEDTGVKQYPVHSESMDPDSEAIHRVNASTDLALAQARICVSQTEWRKGIFRDQASELNIVAEGSVARKLALVSIGRYDLTVSLYPKNDWDIAGGLALILSSGGVFANPENDDSVVLHPPGKTRPGLVCGSAALVSQYQQYFRKKGLRMRASYGSD